MMSKEKTPAQLLFIENGKIAREMVKSGKVATLKEAWAIIKESGTTPAKKETKAEPAPAPTEKVIFFNGLW